MIGKCLKFLGTVSATAGLVIMRSKINMHKFDFNSVLAEEWIDKWDMSTHNTDDSKVCTLLFVRHGSYDKDSGRLNVAGKVECLASAKRLLKMVQSGRYRISRLHSSRADRAVDSLGVIKEFLEKNNVNLPQCEFTSTNTEGFPCRKEPDATGKFHSSNQKWRDGARIDFVFRDIFRRSRCSQQRQAQVKDIEVYVGHSNIHRYLMLRALQVPLEGYLRYTQSCGSFSEFKLFSNGRIICESNGQCGFIYQDMDEYYPDRSK